MIYLHRDKSAKLKPGVRFRGLILLKADKANKTVSEVMMEGVKKLIEEGKDS